MPVTCIVIACGSRAGRDKLSFFAVPKALRFSHATHLNVLSEQRRQQWIKAFKRGDLTESKLKCEKVCSKHFISGKPADLQDVNNPDWVPNQNMGYRTEQALKRKSDLDRMERTLEIMTKRTKNKELQENNENILEEEANTIRISDEESIDGTSVQTDLTTNDLMEQSEALSFSKTKIDKLLCKLSKSMLTYETLESDK